VKCQSLSGAVLAAAAALPPPGVAAAGSASGGVAESVAATVAAELEELDVALSPTSAAPDGEVACARDGHAFASNNSPKNIADTANLCFELKLNSLSCLSPWSVLPTYWMADSVPSAHFR